MTFDQFAEIVRDWQNRHTPAQVHMAVETFLLHGGCRELHKEARPKRQCPAIKTVLRNGPDRWRNVTGRIAALIELLSLPAIAMSS
jgi:hypothetical protein